MNHYVTGSTIKALREKQRLTQSQLAEKLCVSDKTISKWETRRGFPEIFYILPDQLWFPAVELPFHHWKPKTQMTSISRRVKLSTRNMWLPFNIPWQKIIIYLLQRIAQTTDLISWNSIQRETHRPTSFVEAMVPFSGIATITDYLSRNSNYIFMRLLIF